MAFLLAGHFLPFFFSCCSLTSKVWHREEKRKEEMTTWENYFAIWGTCWKSLFKKGRWHFLELVLSGFCGLGNNSGPCWKIAARVWKRHNFPHYCSHSCHNHIALSWPMPSTFMTGTSEGLAQALKANVHELMVSMHSAFILNHCNFSSSSDFLFFCVLVQPTDHSANGSRLHWLVANQEQFL